VNSWLDFKIKAKGLQEKAFSRQGAKNAKSPLAKNQNRPSRHKLRGSASAERSARQIAPCLKKMLLLLFF
jgi:hypothetical protein